MIKNPFGKSNRKIQEAALRLFKEKGYDSVSISEICKSAGCSQSTFYYQFGTKDELLRSIVTVESVIDQELIAALLTLTSPWEKLWKIHESYSKAMSDLGVALMCIRLTSKLSLETQWSDSDEVRYMNRMIIPLIQQGQESGEILNHTPPEKLAMNVTLQMLGVLFWWHADHGSFDLVKEMKEILGNLYDLREDLRD